MADVLESPILVVKGLSINNLPPEAWRIIRGNAAPATVQRVYQAVPWFFRGVHLRANAVSKMPFVIEDLNGQEIDNSKEYKNVLTWLPNPRKLLYLYEASLTVEGAGYLEQVGGAFTGNLLELRYLHPLSMRPHITETGRIDYFERMTKGAASPIILRPDEVVASYLMDPYVEIGTGTAPGRAALAASGVLSNEDEFVASFFSRGAIKATILTMEGGDSDPNEKDRLLTWWQRVTNGVKGAFSSHIVNARVKPEVIGEGIEALSNQTLTREKREDIGTAFGIPHTLLFSDAANYATAGQDDQHFYDKTVVPECDLIADDWNEQVFIPRGYKLRFLPETLDVFQADEQERSTAFKNYVEAGMRPSVAVQVLGIELPKGVDPAQLDADWERQQTMQLQVAQARQASFGQGNKPGQNNKQPQKKALTDGVIDELDRWQRKALKAIRVGKPIPEFTTDIIPPVLAFALREALEGATDADAVKAIFDNALEWEDYA